MTYRKLAYIVCPSVEAWGFWHMTEWYHTEQDRLLVHRVAFERLPVDKYTVRATIIWRASEGESVYAIAKAMGMSRSMVQRWLDRYLEEGTKALNDRPRPAGRKATVVTEENLEALEYEEVLGFDTPVAQTMMVLGVSRRSAQRLVNELRKRAERPK